MGPDTAHRPLPDVVLDSDAESCWRLAAWIGAQSNDDHLRSFTTLLIALLHADNGLSRWFLRYAPAAGIHLRAICGARNFRPGALRDLRPRLEKGELPTGKPETTVSATNMLSGAAELQRQTAVTENGPVGVRHLLGAYVFFVPQVHVKQLAEWGFDRQREGSALLRQVRDKHPEELDRWIKVYIGTLGFTPDLKGPDPVIPSRISGFSPDTADGEDQLNIEDDVYALSALLCSTRVKPPLSIGLFGDWGSGKSFFIRQIQKGVTWISEQARETGRMQKDLPFYKHVVQIEFNAWNYSEGNLWAALVQHILDNLRLSDKEPDDLVKKRREHLQQKMELEQQVRDAAAGRERDAQDKLHMANAELQRLRDDHEEKVTRLKACVATDVLRTTHLEPGTVQQLNELRRRIGLPAVEGSAGEFLSAVEGTRSVLRRASAVFAFVPEEQRAQFLKRSALVLLVPPVAAILVGVAIARVDAYVSSIASLATWLSASLGFGATWLRDRTRVLGDQLAQLERLQDLARQRVEAEEQQHRAEAAALERHISLSQEEILAAQQKQREAQQRLDQIKAQLAGTTPASVLADFVRERSQSEDYRKHLGLPAVIRRDFDNISRMIAQENDELAGKTTLEEELVEAEHRINRIVLYIDDLDRCSEDLVVAVLKAVHLLLAFPLFVVVVAVDARWVSRSLAQRFPGLLAPARPAYLEGVPLLPARADTIEHATPNDYLEKIFQIPLWLRQPSEDSVRRMVHSLLGEVQPAGSGASPATSGPAAGASGATPVGETSVFRRRQHDPNASLLDITADEMSYIDRLAPLLDRSPRALKRFVNVYRLLKASLPPEEHDTFLEQEGTLGGPYAAALLLLAVVNGLPAVSDSLLATLLATDSAATVPKTPTTFGTLIGGIPETTTDAHEQAARLTRWLHANVGENWENTDASRVLEWVPRVARYSYHFHRLSAV